MKEKETLSKEHMFTQVHHLSKKWIIIRIIFMAAILLGAGYFVMLLYSAQNDEIDFLKQQNKLLRDQLLEIDLETELPEVELSKPKVEGESDVLWQFDGEDWSPNGVAPECPKPFVLDLPVERDEVAGLLWPGQVRGDDFKSHGGFRFERGSGYDHTITAPFDMTLYTASRYLESGEEQYFLVFSQACGFVYKFDHLVELGPELSRLTEELPEAKPNDSRTTLTDPPIFLKKGDVIGTKVGITGNEFIDFGVHDVREQNEISKDPEWAEAHSYSKEMLFYGVCWLELLNEDDREYLLGLPIAGNEGETSDYATIQETKHSSDYGGGGY